MATEWFCKIMGDEQGPLSAGQLQALARSGRLTIDDVVRKHADGTWVRAENVIGLFDRPSLPVVVKESIAVIDDFRSIAATWQPTAALSAAGPLCSIEVQTTRSGPGDSWFTFPNSTRSADLSQVKHAPCVVVPRRTLKVGAGASSQAVAEKFANQTTQAAGFNSLADTVANSGQNRPVDALAEHGV
jgi:GYF domain 2